VQLGVIGGGTMGEAMIAAIMNKGLNTAGEICVSDTDEDRRQYLEQTYAVRVTADNRQAADESKMIILAIKPQNLAEVMATLFGRLEPTKLVLSIIAGASVNTLRIGLNHRRIVRCMPNTPAQIGQGMSVWTATPEVTEQQKKKVRSILSAMGREMYADDEKYLDMATAISGSGPAYFFLFAEALIEASVKIGIPRDNASELVRQTIMGAAQLIEKSGKTPADLRKMVTSPGGTTAEALLQLEKGDFNKLVLQAVQAAYNKAKELGKHA